MSIALDDLDVRRQTSGSAADNLPSSHAAYATYEDGHSSEEEDVELESDLDDEDKGNGLSQPDLPQAHPSYFKKYLPRVFHSFLTKSLRPQSESDSAPETEEPQSGQAARRKRKNHKKHENIRKVREVAQGKLGTTLKGVAHRHAAESKTLRTDDDFLTEDLPINSGGWSGLRKILAKVNPEVEHLLGDEYDMQVVDWKGE